MKLEGPYSGLGLGFRPLFPCRARLHQRVKVEPYNSAFAIAHQLVFETPTEGSAWLTHHRKPMLFTPAPERHP